MIAELTFLIVAVALAMPDLVARAFDVSSRFHLPPLLVLPHGQHS